ncbi:DUF4031 domain-containing protein [Burkholderia glumae]|uniref:DUF4031 domain-containing protein n=1 Tax=Burkholderia glumae TaxID=337 RepID=UPI00215152C4|nr:DUF4031 domain-containing protein [Burkholderia glumae]
MAVYVDNALIVWRGKRWCHLVADSLDELHGFAKHLGLRRTWFQDRASYPHYDVTESIRLRALRLGAIQGDKRTIVQCGRSLKQELSGSQRSAQPRAHFQLSFHF